MSKWILLLLLIVAPIVAAQADCPTIVTAALETATENCVELGRNQACYGNITLEATPRSDDVTLNFEQAGDIVNVTDIETLRLSSMSLTDESWGVALMQLQANLPDTLPGQNVTLLLFGDVAITNVDDQITELEVTARGNVNVRLRPTTAESNIISSLRAGQTVTANGRLADGSWIRIVLNAETGELGWVSAEFVNSEVSISRLTVVEVDGALVFSPMQAFYFSSGIGDRPCEEAPDSGILIQTPEGVGEVNFLINEVYVHLGSTVYLQAGAGAMRVSVLEGHATLESNGVSQTVPAGTYSEIPLDNSGLADGTPTFPQPYRRADLLSLPVDIALPQSVIIARAVQGEDDIAVAIDIADGLPPSGRWIINEEFIEGGCGPNDLPDGTRTQFHLNVTFSEDRSSVLWDKEELPTNITWGRIDDMTYSGSTNGADMTTIVFTTPTTFTMTFVGDTTGNTSPECVVRLEGEGYFVGP